MLLQDLISEIDKTAQIITIVKIFKRVHFLNEDNCKTLKRVIQPNGWKG